MVAHRKQIRDFAGLANRRKQAARLFAKGERQGSVTAPKRFLLGQRGWIPRWRFQPTERPEDAFRLLEEAAPQQYKMGREGKGLFWVHVQIGRAKGRARDLSKPRAITLAVARALKLQVDD